MTKLTALQIKNTIEPGMLMTGVGSICKLQRLAAGHGFTATSQMANPMTTVSGPTRP